MARQPMRLDELLERFVERSVDGLSVRLAGSRNMLARADQYLGSGDDNRTVGRNYAALTNYHEAARLALTATILAGGDRLTGGDRAHQAVLDYALDKRFITRPEWLVLDELRRARNEIEYADDATEPSATDVQTVAELAMKLVNGATGRAAGARRPSPANRPAKSPRNAAGKPIPPPPPR